MLDNIVIGKYYPNDSIVNKLNPLCKLCSLILFSVIVFLTDNIIIELALLIFSIIVTIFTKLNYKLFLKNIYNLKILYISILMINLIFKIDIYITIISILKLILIIQYSWIFTYTTSICDITNGLNYILRPLKIFKINSNRLALLITIAIRFIPTIIEQANTILKSLAVRGLDYTHSKFKDKITAINAMIIPMFILSIKKADQVADSMEVKLYNVDKNNVVNVGIWNEIDSIILSLHLYAFLIIFIKEIIL